MIERLLNPTLDRPNREGLSRQTDVLRRRRHGRDTVLKLRQQRPSEHND